MSELGHVASELVKVAEVGVGAKVFGWAGNRLLGPVFDEMGLALRDRYSERRRENFERIGRNAEAKSGAAMDTPGEVNPRVALKILDDGSWCDGPVMAEYFGGILANSRTEDGKDDRGLTWAALVSRLSTADVHVHYLFYDAFRRLYVGTNENLGMSQVRDSAKVFLDGGDVLAAIGAPVTMEDWARLIVPSINALIREDLLGPTYSYGNPEHLETAEGIDTPGIGAVLTPSVAGCELFLWAFNHGGLPMQAIVSPELSFESQEGLQQLGRARKVVDMRVERAERLQRENDPGGGSGSG